MPAVPAAVPSRELLPPEGVAHTIDTPEGPVYYLEAGTGEPLLLVSAWGPTPGATAWLAYRDVLAVLSKSYRCIVVELSNYGHTGPVTFHEPAHDVCVRAVVRVLDHLGLARVTAIGTSMGARPPAWTWRCSTRSGWSGWSSAPATPRPAVTRTCSPRSRARP
jgi:pimeloyl-ACP methyl ester carboxylesterase